MCIVTSEDRAQSALRAVAQFANVAGQVQHDELRSASLQVAHEALAQCEAHGQRCVEFLLTALRQSTKANASAVEDVVWMVYKVARGSDTAKAWIVHAGGVAALRAALLCHADQPQLMENGVWTAYALDGLRSLAELLSGCRGDTMSDLALRGAICGALYQLVKPRRGGLPASCQTLEVVQPESVVVLITEALHMGRLPEDALWTSCTVLDTLVEKDPRMAAVFMARGGCQLLVRMLSRDVPQGFDGQDLRRAIASLVVTLADACPEAVQAFRSAGASKVLLEEGLKGDGADVEAAMWAIGAIDGLDTVLQAMRTSGPLKPKVLVGGACALTACAFKASDPQDLQKLPAAIVLLLDIIANPGNEPKLPRVAVKALGCALAALTPHAPPGQLTEVDRGVEALIQQLMQSPNKAKEAALAEEAHKETWWNGDDGKDGYDVPVAPVAQAAVEAIGRIALTTSQWRPVLKEYSMEALLGWIRSGVPDRKLNKYLFWAAAAMSGMPFVASELKLHINGLSAVDAALCTIIDILDEDIDGEYTLAGADRGEAEMPELLALVIEAMQKHISAPEVQGRGASCISLLVPYMPPVSLNAMAPGAINTVLNGSRRFPRRMDVMSGSAAALRSFCELCRRMPPGPLGKAIVETLRHAGAVDCVEQVFCIFSHYEDSTEMLEDAAAVHCQLSGVEALLNRLETEPATSLLRIAGLKALFEEGRLGLDFFTTNAAAAAIEACERMVHEAHEYNETGKDAADPPVDTTRLHEVASLLSGLCRGRLQTMCAAG